MPKLRIEKILAGLGVRLHPFAAPTQGSVAGGSLPAGGSAQRTGQIRDGKDDFVTPIDNAALCESALAAEDR